MTNHNTSLKSERDLDEAREILGRLDQTLEADKASAFSTSVLRALALVKVKDPAAYGRAKIVLQAAKISMRDVERALNRRGESKLRIVSEDGRRTAGTSLG